MKWRMHKRTETKPDGRKIYYYTFEPLLPEATDSPQPPAPAHNERIGTAPTPIEAHKLTPERTNHPRA